MKTYHLVVIFWILLLGTHPLAAQADHIEQSGLIYTVISCVAVIIIGIVLFLFYLERRLTAMEKELKK